MEIHKAWAMPNAKTFKIKPIKGLILKYAKSFGDKSIVVDPFANEGSIAQNLPPGTTYISNDLDTQYDTTYHLDALDFLRQFKDGSVDMVLFDPPYSPRQTSECYKKLGRTVTTQDTSSKPFAEFKKEIARILRIGGICISCMWNTNGIGKGLGMEQIEILLVAHGGMHNDTLCVVDRKNKN